MIFKYMAYVFPFQYKKIHVVKKHIKEIPRMYCTQGPSNIICKNKINSLILQKWYKISFIQFDIIFRSFVYYLRDLNNFQDIFLIFLFHMSCQMLIKIFHYLSNETQIKVDDPYRDIWNLMRKARRDCSKIMSRYGF